MARFERSNGRESKPRRRESSGREDKPRRRESSDRNDRSESSSGGYEEYAQNKKEGRGSRGPRGGRSYGRESFGRERRAPLEMTKVICSACKEECEVPFKPRTDKPVYCSACFSKNNDDDDRGSRGRFGGNESRSARSSNDSSRDMDVINEKLNKIMKALKIE